MKPGNEVVENKHSIILKDKKLDTEALDKQSLDKDSLKSNRLD